MGCTNCTYRTIESLQSNQWTAELEYRVCGSYSGFSVAVYRTNNGRPGYGEGSKEPFQAARRSSKPYSFEKPPISIKWTGDHNLTIYHDTRMSIDDSISKLMIFRADSHYQNISISYEPKPTLWKDYVWVGDEPVARSRSIK
jgi:hypothetical protein